MRDGGSRARWRAQLSPGPHPRGAGGIGACPGAKRSCLHTELWLETPCDIARRSPPRSCSQGRAAPPRLPVPAVHRACGGEPAARGSGSAAPASTRDNRVATVQSVVRQTATCRGTPAQSDRPTAHPDAGVSEAPARADTFAHGETAGCRGSYLETFSGYM